MLVCVNAKSDKVSEIPRSAPPLSEVGLHPPALHVRAHQSFLVYDRTHHSRKACTEYLDIQRFGKRLCVQISGCHIITGANVQMVSHVSSVGILIPKVQKWLLHNQRIPGLIPNKLNQRGVVIEMCKVFPRASSIHPGWELLNWSVLFPNPHLCQPSYLLLPTPPAPTPIATKGSRNSS